MQWPETDCQIESISAESRDYRLGIGEFRAALGYFYLHSKFNKYQPSIKQIICFTIPLLYRPFIFQVFGDIIINLSNFLLQNNLYFVEKYKVKEKLREKKEKMMNYRFRTSVDKAAKVFFQYFNYY